MNQERWTTTQSISGRGMKADSDPYRPFAQSFIGYLSALFIFFYV